MVGERRLGKLAWVLAFVSPSLVGLTVFSIIPILASLGLTFYEWDLLTPPHFVGLGNFQRLIHDRNFWSALAGSVPGQLR